MKGKTKRNLVVHDSKMTPSCNHSYIVMTSHEFLSGAWFAGLLLLYSKNRQGKGATGRNVFYCVQLKQEPIGSIMVDVYKMQKFQRNHSRVLSYPYRREPWERGRQMEHDRPPDAAHPFCSLKMQSARFSVPHHSAAVNGLIFFIVVVLLDIVLF